MKSSGKRVAFVITTFFHIVAAIVLCGISFGVLEKLNIEADRENTWSNVYFCVGVISMIITMAFVLLEKSRGGFAVIALILPVVTVILTKDLWGVIGFLGYSLLLTVICLILQYLMSLGALYNWFKKQKKDEWDCDVVVQKSIHEQIYEEYGIFH